jgi:predicted O-linked N-acetylglucosamine transferase (SPINDLY family)/acetyltransferase-like isoleucine patch superfamily enzyme/GT2 family glycosyltransferase
MITSESNVKSSQNNNVSTGTKATNQVKGTPVKVKANCKPNISEINNLAFKFNDGQIEESERLAISFTQQYPREGFGWKILGAILQKQGLVEEAGVALQKAVEFLPKDSEAQYNLGNFFYDQLQLDEAICSYKKSLKINPRFAQAHYNLGSVFKDQKKFAEAGVSYKAALKLDPNNVPMNFNVALMFYEQKQYKEAVHYFQKAVKLQDDYISAYVNLGASFKALGQLKDAETCYRKALTLDSDNAEAHNNLGAVLKVMGFLEEAEDCYKTSITLDPEYYLAHNNYANLLRESGRLADAVVFYKNTIKICPDFVSAYDCLGLTLSAMGLYSDAQSAFEKGIEHAPDNVAILSNFCITLISSGQLTKAESYLKRTLELSPQFMNAHMNMCVNYLAQGRVDDAVAISKEALLIQPDNLGVYNNLLFSMNYLSSFSPSETLEKASQFGAIVASKVDVPFTSWKCKTPLKRLRVGLVSGDFRNHAVAYFLENLLKNIDQASIDLIAYSTVTSGDQVTSQLKPYFSSWNSLEGLDDKSAAKLIYDDGLHVLVDLSGHTAGNRLPIFAWKPAPLQVSWLGYFATTGMSSIDYFIADQVGVPEDNKCHFIEKIKYIPDTRLCFTAPDLSINVSALPALANKYITFGCFQNLAKVGDEVLDLWAEVMKAIPSSRLRWQCKSFRDGHISEDIKNKLLKRGIHSDRVDMFGSTTREEYLASHNSVDIILDVFPFPGGTTTCEALWMGVPTLTLAGESLIARQGASIMTAAGLSNWIAYSKEEYLNKLLKLSSDFEKLSKLRTSLRQVVLESPLFDAPRFARNLEKILWEMWNETHIINAKAIEEASREYFETKIDDGTSEKLITKNVEIISATKLSEIDFWEKSALGLSLRRHLKKDARLSLKVAFDNSRGLSEIFNESINQADDNAILVFIHDDVWIDEAEFVDSVIKGLENFDVIGVAGNKRRVPLQPGWLFLDTKFTRDNKDNVSGQIAHGRDAFGVIGVFGETPSECELLDGVFLATTKSILVENNVWFDNQFDFHFYDLDFCRTARKSGLRLGTWIIKLTHQSSGNFGSKHWLEKYQSYINKWETTLSNNSENFSKNANTQINQELNEVVNEVLQMALDFQNSGDIEESQKLYLEVLKIQPKHAEANHNLGVIEAHLNGAQAALPMLEIAVQESSENEQYWVSYIDALMQSGSPEVVADALELGQKYGLKSETAQLLAKEYVTIFDSRIDVPQDLENPSDLTDTKIELKSTLNNSQQYKLTENVNNLNMSELHGTPIMSLCIPTFNRGNLLKETLESITSQNVFLNTNEVEIVIADNLSTDETQSVSEAFVKLHPGKIKYFRNSSNIGASMNFELALSHGEGKFLKLLNDNLMVRDGSLIEILKLIKATSDEKPVIFFTNGSKPSNKLIAVANNLNEFVKEVSYFSTWIGGFGIWREDFQNISDFSRHVDSLLTQTDVLFRMVASGKRALIPSDKYFVGLDVGKKGGYNIAEVFGKNYLSFLKDYCAVGTLDASTFEVEKKEILLKHIIPYYFDEKNGFNKTGFFEYMQDYINDDYFHKAIEGLISNRLNNDIVKETPEQRTAEQWRLLNSHNETQLQLKGLADLNKIKVGRRTYGKIFLHGFGNENESLTIGNFVSIADDVKFILGGNHPYLGFSTYPFKAMYFSTLEATTKGGIVIGDDVWIGYNSTILSGVNIGQGAVIAAGSMVTRDVAPYSIVGGNPAKLIKYRFDKEVIDKLCSFDFSQLGDDDILRNKDNLYTELTLENVDDILLKLK